MNRIGTITESSLHAALKEYYALPGDKIEEPVAGYFADILRGDEIIEIQTGNFTSLRPKLARLLENYHVKVIVPVAVERKILRIGIDGKISAIRKSPKKGRVEDLFQELVRIPKLLNHPNLVIEAALVEDECQWINDGKGSWRRKRWSIHDRILVRFIGSYEFAHQDDYLKLIPDGLSKEFTARDLALAAKLNPRLASKILYCFRAMDIVRVIGKQGKAYLYQRCT